MIDKIEITIVKNGVRHILQPEIADSENYADSIASMICEVVVCAALIMTTNTIAFVQKNYVNC